MTARHDPFAIPFPDMDTDCGDIDAGTTADRERVAGDFTTEAFTGLSANHQSDPQGSTIALPGLALDRDEWLRQAQSYLTERTAGVLDGDPRDHIFTATRLEEIGITGDAARTQEIRRLAAARRWQPRPDELADALHPPPERRALEDHGPYGLPAPYQGMIMASTAPRKVFTAALATETNIFSPIVIDRKGVEGALYAPGPASGDPDALHRTDPGRGRSGRVDRTRGL